MIKTKFEISVFAGNQTDEPSRAYISLYPSSSEHIIDMSKHISVLSLGQKSGKFKLTANLLDIEKSSSVGYLWTCHTVPTLQPCALTTDQKHLVIDRDVQNRRQLVINSDMLAVGQYRFGCHAKDTNQMSASPHSAYTTVTVFEGNSPQVFIESVHIRQNGRNIRLLFNRDHSDVISVPSMAALRVRAVVRKLRQIDAIEWHLSDSVYHLSWDNVNSKTGIVSELNLYPGLNNNSKIALT